jgi:hypothetical protein
MLAINRLQHLPDDYKVTINSQSYKVIAQRCDCLVLGDMHVQTWSKLLL